jgi:hypothetical protein
LLKQFEAKPKDQSALRRAAATTARAKQQAQSDLARQVAEKLATADPSKLEQIAALLNKEAAAVRKPVAPTARRAANTNAANENKGDRTLGTRKPGNQIRKNNTSA